MRFFKRGFLAFLCCVLCAQGALGAEFVKFVDDSGQEVTVPRSPERVLITSIMPLTSVYCLYRGGITGLIGISDGTKVAARYSYLAKMFPEILDIPSDFMKGGEVNVEEVLKLKPDVVFYNASRPEEGEAYRRIGLPAVCFRTEKYHGDPLGTIADWLGYLERIFGAGEGTAGVSDYGMKTLQMVRDRIAAAGDLKRPKAVIFAGYSGNQLVASGSNHYSEFYLRECGAVNAAAEIDGQKGVNLEQVYEWDPEVILINNFCPYVPEDFYENKIAGYDWGLVSAVKNKRVYKFPLGIYRWYPPSGDTPLCILWVAQQLHPELFSDVDIAKELRDYYQKFYHYEPTDEDIAKILHPGREAAIFN